MYTKISTRFLLLLLSLLGFAAALTKVDRSTGKALDEGNRRLGVSGRSPLVSATFRKLMMESDDSSQRKLLESCNDDSSDDFFGGDGIFTCIDSGELPFTGSCGAISQRVLENWCVDNSENEVCCSIHGDDCCEITGGGIALLVIVPLVAILLIVLASCACCSCCPLHSKLCCAGRKK